MIDSNDVYNAVRRRTLPHLHGALDLLIGGYALSDTPAEEYVATVHAGTDDVEQLLASLGFHRGLVASMKVRVDGNVSDGSWVYRPSPLADHQLHVVLHEAEVGDGVKLYAHTEYSWITHPYRHYLAREYSAERGIELTRDLLVRIDEDVLSDEAWTIRPRHRRQSWYAGLVRALSDGVANRLVEVPERFGPGLTSESQGVLQRATDRLR